MKLGVLNILMAEDEENDIFFVRRALAVLGAQHNLFAVRDGQEAISYLKGDGQYGDRDRFPMPNIILTDVKMPRMDGFEFLLWLKNHPDCGVIPTIVYSSSRMESDVQKAYSLGANVYFVKPGTLEEMTAFLRLTSEYWSQCEIPQPVPKC